MSFFSFAGETDFVLRLLKNQALFPLLILLVCFLPCLEQFYHMHMLIVIPGFFLCAALSSLVLFHMNCSCLFFLDSQLHVLNLGGLPSSASVSLLSAVTWKLSQGCKMEFVIELTLVVSHFSGVTGLHCLMSVFSKLLFHIVGQVVGFFFFFK